MIMMTGQKPHFTQSLNRGLGVGQVLNAYILIQSDMGGAAVVTELVQAIPGVAETEIVTGSYDVVARVQAHDMDELTKRLTPQIQAVRGVMRTAICIIVQPPFYFYDREAAARHGRSDSTRRNGLTRHLDAERGIAVDFQTATAGEMAGGGDTYDHQ